MVKNAVDATSKTEDKENKSIEIDIVSRLSHNFCSQIREKLQAELKANAEEKQETVEKYKTEIESKLIKNNYLVSELLGKISESSTIQELLNIIDEANYIQIADKGEGMSLTDLDKIYLTIGTNYRYNQKKEGENVLGEKGIGRLSAMRLGNKLQVKTTKKNESKSSLLEIDWREFSHDSEKLIEDIKVYPKEGDVKKDKTVSGTTIKILALNSHWNEEKVSNLVQDQFSRFTDPFRNTQEEIKKYFKHPVPKLASSESLLDIKTYYNNKPFSIHPFEKEILKYAHASVWAEFKVISDEKDNLKSSILEGEIFYRHRNERKIFKLEGVELSEQTKAGEYHLQKALKTLGPFKMIAFWFNRGLLLESEGVPDATNIKKIVKRWGGGLMLFRDGFRIFPYGDPHTDDWLNVDERGLASQGFKVNRRQLIGKVDITSKQNPHLIDQTNRQGLRDNDEKIVLIQLLKHILDGELRPYLTGIDKLLRYKDLDLDDFDRQIKKQVNEIKSNTDVLLSKAPDEEYVISFINTLNESINKIQKTFNETKTLAESYKQGKEVTIHLAGVGQMVEFISHELNRATDNAIKKINSSSDDVKNQFKSLEEQLKTIQKRLSVLDPISVSGRQRKSLFDLTDWIKHILETHEAQFTRHNIKYSITEVPQGRKWKVNAIKGMIVQVFENLINNSVYWFKQLEKLNQTDTDGDETTLTNESFKPKIDILIDTENKLIKFTDNGIGILPERKEDIFLPYVTTKPPNKGHGLGLFIAREIATYHDAIIYLSDKPTIHPDRLNTFIFEFNKGDDI